jgi:hypothetical protein
MIAFGFSLTGIFNYQTDKRKRLFGLLGNSIIVGSFIFLSIWALVNDENQKESKENQLSKTALGYIKELEAKNIRIYLDSLSSKSQLNLEITDSERINRYLSMPFDSLKVDSAYLFSLDLSTKLHKQLRKDYQYQSLHLSFLRNDNTEQYNFNYCISNCK